MIILCILLCILAVLAFLVYASYSISAGIYLRSFCRQATTKRVVALTFDDGPDSIRTPKVLNILREYNVPACFFCIGHKVAGNEKLLQQIISEGHLIGNHSFSHANGFPAYSLPKMKKDLQTCQSALERVTSQPIKLFRPPFGVTTPTLAKAVHQLGYRSIGWNIRTLDTCLTDQDKIIRLIRKRLRPGSVILLHDRMPGSDQLLKRILQLLKEQKYTVVPLDDML